MKTGSLLKQPLRYTFAAVWLALPIIPTVAQNENAQGQQVPACDGLTTTAAMVSCEQTRFQHLSQDMQSIYVQLQKQLSPGSKIRLASSQVAWIKFRDSSAALEASTEQGGTLAQLLQITTKADLTQQRVLQLQKLSNSQGAH